MISIGEDALANLSVEKMDKGEISGYICIASRQSNVAKKIQTSERKLRGRLVVDSFVCF